MTKWKRGYLVATEDCDLLIERNEILLTAHEAVGDTTYREMVLEDVRVIDAVDDIILKMMS